MNAFAKCQIRKPQLMHLLAGYLEGRLEELSPQNVSNVAHAFARLECYDQQLFYSIQQRLLKEDLRNYKLYELANLVHSLAKLKCGGKKTKQISIRRTCYSCWCHVYVFACRMGAKIGGAGPRCFAE